MFNIALVSHSQGGHSQYIEALNEKNCSIHFFEPQDLNEQIKNMDAVMIKEASLEEIGQTCELIIRIRNLTNRFIWVLSDCSTKINRMVYLQLGSDGTFDDRYDSDEFGLYVQTALDRRQENTEVLSSKIVSEGGAKNHVKDSICLIPTNFSVDVEGIGEVSLTKLEFQALEILIDHKGEAVSYEEMYRTIWGKETADQKYRISNLIFHLRKKIGDDPFKPKYIKTVRSRGYMLSV